MKYRAVATILSLLSIMATGSVMAATAEMSVGGFASENSRLQDSDANRLWRREQRHQQLRNGDTNGKQHRFQYQYNHRWQTAGERRKWKWDDMDGKRNGNGRH